MNTVDRSYLGFEEKVKKSFRFLLKLGFSATESLPTVVCYKKDDVEVHIYHGQQSYEVGADISICGDKYQMADIVNAIDSKAAKLYRIKMTSNPEILTSALEELSSLMQHYGSLALQGDLKFFADLEKKRDMWAKEYALDVLASQIRPQAEESFRHKDYAKAFELYSKMRKRLTSAEKKKLLFCKKYFSAR